MASVIFGKSNWRRRGADKKICSKVNFYVQLTIETECKNVVVMQIDCRITRLFRINNVLLFTHEYLF